MARPFKRTLEEMAAFLGAGIETENAARRDGLLQRVDPRIRLAAALLVLLTAAFARSPATLALLGLLTLAVAILSALPSWPLLRRVLVVTALFAGVATAPAVLQVVTPGPVAFELPWGLSLSSAGLTSAARLVLRAGDSVLVVLTLVGVTPWPRVLASLRALGVPAAAVSVLGIGHRYVYLLLEEARGMLVARETRRVGKLSGATARRELGGAAGALLMRSAETAEQVHAAMRARGFTGIARALDAPRPTAGDALFLLAAVALLGALLVVDRGL